MTSVHFLLLLIDHEYLPITINDDFSNFSSSSFQGYSAMAFPGQILFGLICIESPKTQRHRVFTVAHRFYLLVTLTGTKSVTIYVPGDVQIQKEQNRFGWRIKNTLQVIDLAVVLRDGINLNIS